MCVCVFIGDPLLVAFDIRGTRWNEPVKYFKHGIWSVRPWTPIPNSWQDLQCNGGIANIMIDIPVTW